MEETMRQRRRRREFTDAYKAEVVALCEKGDRAMAEVARDLDLTETSVRRWVAQAEVEAGRRPGAHSGEIGQSFRLKPDTQSGRIRTGRSEATPRRLWTCQRAPGGPRPRRWRSLLRRRGCGDVGRPKGCPSPVVRPGAAGVSGRPGVHGAVHRAASP